jgi:cell division protein FtsZ
MFQNMDEKSQGAVMKVIGIGGAGCNAVQNMIEYGIEGVQYICIDSDKKSLEKSSAKQTLQISQKLAKSLNAGTASKTKKIEAGEVRKRIHKLIAHSDMIFIIVGMGGGGSSVSSVVAQVAHELEILIIAMVTKPLTSEPSKRKDMAEKSINQLSTYVDTLIVIPNDKLILNSVRQSTKQEIFNSANEILRDTVSSIATMISTQGLICIDFADVRTVTFGMGIAVCGIGEGYGKDRAKYAALNVISSPLLDDVNISDAHGILITIWGGMDLSICDIDDVGNTISGMASDDAVMVVGTVLDSDLPAGILRVMLVATGINKEKLKIQEKVETYTGEINFDNSGHMELLEVPSFLHDQKE